MEALRERFIKVSVAMSLVVLFLLASNAFGWTAYNDCVYDITKDQAATNPNGQSVHYIADNVTTYGIGSGSIVASSGELVDFVTAASTGITAALTQNGGVIWQPDISTSWTGGYDTALGTDARNTFGGIADMTGVIYYGGSPGWYVDLTFTGLDANKEYTFATSAARCRSIYDNRNTIYKISGADTYTNASTTGVNVTSQAEVWFNTGNNHDTGYVARWTGITASDGTFTVRATHHAVTESDRKAYAFDVFMLEEQEPVASGAPVTFVVCGDTRGGDNGVNTTILAEIVAATIAEGVDFILLPGDLVTGSSTQSVLESQLTTWVSTMQPLYDAGIGVYPVRGNHDAGSLAAWNNVFSGAYALPANGPVGEENLTYSFTFDNIFVVGVDQYVNINRVNQVWLDGQFAVNTQPHVFVFGHAPAFKVSHNDCLDDYPTERNNFWNSIVAEGGRSYFAGHDHFYDHCRLDDSDGDPDNDAHQYIVGTGGAPLYSGGAYDGDNGSWTPQGIHFEAQYGYVLVEVDGPAATLTWKHRTSAGVYETDTDTFSYTLPPTIVCEDFNSGFSIGLNVGDHADWYDGGGGPVVTAGAGLDGSVGLGIEYNIFTWTAHPFDWSDPSLTKVVFQMDFQTDPSGNFDDDRCVWNTDGAGVSSSNLFGAQLDHINGGIVTYWRNSGGTRIQTPIVSLNPLSASTWYRFRNEITKLTATSARLDVSLVELDAQGAEIGAPYTGTVADTSLWPGGVPDTKYFTAPIMYPSYKNYDALTGNADNACFEVSTGTLTTYTISGNIVDLDGLPVEGVEVSASNSGGSDTTVANGNYILTVNENWSGTVTPTKSGYTFDPASTSYTTVTADQTGQNCVASEVAAGPAEWTAYNDCVYDVTLDQSVTNPIGQSVHYIADNVTIYNIGNNSPGPSSGDLVDFATGTSTGVTATLVQSGGVMWQPDVSSNWYGGYDTSLGTDARNTFGGIADMTGVTYYGSSAGWYVDLTFTGLDANKEYTFATSAARCGTTADYTNRYSIFSISGADTYTNASTTGVNVTSEAEVWFNTGDNYNEGYVARWTGITASNGTFAVRATHHASANSGRKAYAFDVFMLQQQGGGVVPPPVPPVEFVAYNDMNPIDSTNADNVTEHDYEASDASLVDFGSGIELPVTITGATVNGYDPYPNGGAFTNVNSDAYKAFNGIVDMAGVFELDFADWDHIITFNDLDPNNEYTITLTANRDEIGYAGERYTRVTIEGAEAFTNASSAGVTVNSEDSVSFSIGYNTVNGYVAKWTGVKTGPDGSFSIKSEWDNSFGGSKGYAMSAFCLEAFGPPQELPVMQGDEWAYFKGSEEPPAEWALVDFDDSGWLTGATGIGYSDGDDATVLSDMRYSYVSVYARKVFIVSEPNGVTRLLLSMDYDDSFVAYLNGVEVARANVTGNPPAYDLAADSDHEASSSSSNPVEFFQIDPNLLVTGKNVLAIQGHNKSIDSSDFTMIPQLQSVDYDWVAFVDLNSAAQVNDSTHPFALGLDPWTAAFTTTDWTLKDFDTGSDLPAALSIAMDIRYPIAENGGNCNFNTDSDAFFGGIIDLLGSIEIDLVNTFLTTTFKNLDPAMEYEVAVTYNRDNPPYTDRVSKFEIADADTFVQASSDGVVVNSESSVSFCTGYNTVNGYVARWAGVTTSSGIFSITATQDVSKPEWEGDKAYTMTAVMLKQIGPHSLEPDTTAPIISNILAVPTSTTATITCTTDEYTTSSVACGPTTAYEDGSVVNNTLSKAHSADLTGLLPGTEYHYQITCMDYSGNEIKSADQTFTTSATIYSEDFQAYQAGSDPQGWFDTAAGNSLVQDDSLFKTLADNSNTAFGTSSSATNIHSHYVGGQSSLWADYTYSGRMMMSSSDSGIGVTILSDYPNSDSYYRLRRYASGGFHISPHGTSITSGNTDTGVVPSAGTWYRFAVKVSDAGTHTEIAAKVWQDGTGEPGSWQAVCYDANSGRLIRGTIGVWTMLSGTKYFEDLEVEPEIVVPDNTPPVISNIQILLSSTSANVKCTTDEASSSSVAFGKTIDCDLGVISNSSMLTSHSGTINNLDPNTTYYCNITCTDGSSNSATTDVQEFRTTLTPVITTLYSEDFNGYQHLDEPQGWVDTGSGNSLTESEGLFKVLAEDGNRAFGTTATASNIHSHYIAEQSSDWADYTYSGRMMMTSSDAGLGVTIFSDYVNSDSYYRLRRYGSGGFHISPHGTSITSGNTNTSVVPQANQWYRFIIKVEATDTYTDIKAKVWLDGDDEPGGWQADCQDASGSRLTKGTIGVWTMSSGTKYFDDLEVEPEVVIPGNTGPVISNVAADPSATNAQVTCTTDEPATSSVAYGLTGSYEIGDVTNSTRTTNHSVLLTGLVPNTLYYYQITCTDKSGNPATAAGSTFTTTDVPATIYSEDFNAYSSGDDPQGWVDTNSGNSLIQNDSLFEVQQSNGDTTFGTSSSSTNIHSHY